MTKGKRRLLRNEPIAWAFGCLLDGANNVETVTVEELEAIPLGLPAVFEEGPNNVIVRRMLEKVGRIELISAD